MNKELEIKIIEANAEIEGLYKAQSVLSLTIEQAHSTLEQILFDLFVDTYKDDIGRFEVSDYSEDSYKVFGEAEEFISTIRVLLNLDDAYFTYGSEFYFDIYPDSTEIVLIVNKDLFTKVFNNFNQIGNLMESNNEKQTSSNNG